MRLESVKGCQWELIYGWTSVLATFLHHQIFERRSREEKKFAKYIGKFFLKVTFVINLKKLHFMLRNKRLLSAQGGNKRFKSDSENLIPANPFPVNAAPGMQPPENAPLVFPLGSLPPEIPAGLNPMDSEELDESLTESELKGITYISHL